MKPADKINQIKDLFSSEVWRIDARKLAPKSKNLLCVFRGIFLLAQEVNRKNTFVKASALSYTTVLGIIPLVILIFCFSQGFLTEQAKTWVPETINRVVRNVTPYLESIPGEEGGIKVRHSAQREVVSYITSILNGIDVKKLGLFGAIPLIMVAYSLLRTIENMLNDIWGVRKGRSFWRQLTRYWLVVTITPLLVLLSIWLTGTYQVQSIFDTVSTRAWILRDIWGYIGPMLIVSVGFTFFYKLVPNTYVRFLPALAGGLAAGLLWHINNTLGFMYINGALRWKSLYGSIGIIPIFLGALYLAWLFVLLGAHISFVVQNLEMFRGRHLADTLTPGQERKVALACALLIAYSFENGKPGPTKSELATMIGYPSSFLENVIFKLKQNCFIQENADLPPRFFPARPPETTTISQVMDGIYDGGGDDSEVFDTKLEVWRAIAAIGERFEEERTLGYNPTLAELVEISA